MKQTMMGWNSYLSMVLAVLLTISAIVDGQQLTSNNEVKVLSDKQEVQQSNSVSFYKFEYIGRDDNDLPLKTGYYRNPIIAGFHPDPSVCRVGDDYYLINSTFEYFPGLPIFHSTDMVNWKQIGNVIHRPEQLDYKGHRISNGLFAPAISYHDGMFYVACTMVDGFGNFVVTAENPAGPWSNPVSVNFQGIDPSIFFDDDGRAWIVNNDSPDGPPQYSGHRSIWIQQFDYKAMMMIGPRTMIVNGGVDFSQKPIWIEGPHIYKRNGWYYLCCAEGGTSTGHTQVILRSKAVEGPYTPWENNPILSQRDLNADVPGAVTCTGHADMVIGPDGNWWAVFLAVRPYDGRYSAMGRETFMLPVTWTEDGWPAILEHGRRVPLEVESPLGAEVKYDSTSLSGSFTWVDDFNNNDLSFEWIMLREPQKRWWNIDPLVGKMEFTPQAEKLYGTGNPSFMGHRVRNNNYIASLNLDVPQKEGISAGLALLMTEKYYYFLAVKRNSDDMTVYVESANGGQVSCMVSNDLPVADKIDLRIETNKANSIFQLRTDGGEWKSLADSVDAKIISFSIQGGLFLGATVGPYARIDD